MLVDTIIIGQVVIVAGCVPRAPKVAKTTDLTTPQPKRVTEQQRLRRSRKQREAESSRAEQVRYLQRNVYTATFFTSNYILLFTDTESMFVCGDLWNMIGKNET